eukprot:SAG11_NODE_39767_length_221_cov_303.090164_1_plen_57_part_10
MCRLPCRWLCRRRRHHKRLWKRDPKTEKTHDPETEKTRDPKTEKRRGCSHHLRRHHL